MKITEEQIKELDNGNTTVRELFPEVFELEVGKWYKRPHNKALFKALSEPDETCRFEVYGFDTRGVWMNYKKSYTFGDNEIEATELEVFEALKNEAVRRGFKEGVKFKSAAGNDEFVFKKIWTKNLFCNNMMWSSDGGIIFINGKWAEIIEEPEVIEYTIQDAIEKLKTIHKGKNVIVKL